jgi:hypothetical protein
MRQLKEGDQLVVNGLTLTCKDVTPLLQEWSKDGICYVFNSPEGRKVLTDWEVEAIQTEAILVGA